MAENKYLLILRLEGALQAWGEDSKWDFRDSTSMPTKSGIVGLLECALGAERDSTEIVELSDAITVAVRADRPGTKLVDFQTVTGAPLMAATGKPKTTGNTIISSRTYLQDACFTVFIQTDKAWHDRLVAALSSPRWCMYLGRKNCVPSRPALESAEPEYASVMGAVQNYPAADRASLPMAYEYEQPEPGAVSVFRPDELIGVGRRFAMRKVWRGVIKEADYVSDQS